MEMGNVLKIMLVVVLAPIILWLCVWNAMAFEDWIKTFCFSEGSSMIRSFNYVRTFFWGMLAIGKK